MRHLTRIKARRSPWQAVLEGSSGSQRRVGSSSGVLLVAEEDAPVDHAWAKLCVQHSDIVLLVGAGGGTPSLGELEELEALLGEAFRLAMIRAMKRSQVTSVHVTVTVFVTGVREIWGNSAHVQ